MGYLIFCFVFLILASLSQAERPHWCSVRGNLFFENCNSFFTAPDVGTLDLSILSLNICFELYFHSMHFQFDLLAH